MVHTHMGFIGVILSVKKEGLCFIGLWYILDRVQYNRVQYNTVIVYSTVIQYEL